MLNWHRLFGLTLIDFFSGTRYIVELEKGAVRLIPNNDVRQHEIPPVIHTSVREGINQLVCWF